MVALDVVGGFAATEAGNLLKGIFWSFGEQLSLLEFFREGKGTWQNLYLQETFFFNSWYDMH